MAQNSDLMVNLVKSAPAFPEDTTLPFPLSKYSTHLEYMQYVICKY